MLLPDLEFFKNAYSTKQWTFDCDLSVFLDLSIVGGAVNTKDHSASRKRKGVELTWTRSKTRKTEKVHLFTKMKRCDHDSDVDWAPSLTKFRNFEYRKEKNGNDQSITNGLMACKAWGHNKLRRKNRMVPHPWWIFWLKRKIPKKSQNHDEVSKNNVFASAFSTSNVRLRASLSMSSHMSFFAPHGRREGLYASFRISTRQAHLTWVKWVQRECYSVILRILSRCGLWVLRVSNFFSLPLTHTLYFVNQGNQREVAAQGKSGGNFREKDTEIQRQPFQKS